MYYVLKTTYKGGNILYHVSRDNDCEAGCPKSAHREVVLDSDKDRRPLDWTQAKIACIRLQQSEKGRRR